MKLAIFQTLVHLLFTIYIANQSNVWSFLVEIQSVYVVGFQLIKFFCENKVSIGINKQL